MNNSMLRFFSDYNSNNNQSFKSTNNRKRIVKNDFKSDQDNKIIQNMYQNKPQLKKIQRVIEEKSMEKRTPSLSNNDVSEMTVIHPNE